MTFCEDYPCCGHGPQGDGGACPDEFGRFPCCVCGVMLPGLASSSICAACTRRMARQSDAYSEYDYGMNY